MAHKDAEIGMQVEFEKHMHAENELATIIEISSAHEVKVRTSGGEVSRASYYPDTPHPDTPISLPACYVARVSEESNDAE